MAAPNHTALPMDPWMYAAMSGKHSAKLKPVQPTPGSWSYTITTTTAPTPALVTDPALQQLQQLQLQK